MDESSVYGVQEMDAVVCAKNEARSVAHVVKNLYAAGVSHVIVVDDGSTDSTNALANQAGALVITGPQQGKGAAMMTGLAEVTTDRVLFFDADIIISSPERLARLLSLSPSGQVVVFRNNGGRLTRLPPISGERHMPTSLARKLHLKDWKAELQIDSMLGAIGAANIHAKAGTFHGNPGKIHSNPLANVKEAAQVIWAGTEYSYGLIRYPDTVRILQN